MRIRKCQPIRGMGRQQSHAVTLVQRQSDVDQISQKVDKLLPGRLNSFNYFECRSGRQHRLNRSDEHHHHHHDREDTDRASGHVHNQQVHGELFDRTQRNVP